MKISNSTKVNLHGKPENLDYLMIYVKMTGLAGRISKNGSSRNMVISLQAKSYTGRISNITNIRRVTKMTTKAEMILTHTITRLRGQVKKLETKADMWEAARAGVCDRVEMLEARLAKHEWVKIDEQGTNLPSDPDEEVLWLDPSGYMEMYSSEMFAKREVTHFMHIEKPEESKVKEWNTRQPDTYLIKALDDICGLKPDKGLEGAVWIANNALGKHRSR
jgi:hypothetical protein